MSINLRKKTTAALTEICMKNKIKKLLIDFLKYISEITNFRAPIFHILCRVGLNDAGNIGEIKENVSVHWFKGLLILIY